MEPEMGLRTMLATLKVPVKGRSTTASIATYDVAVAVMMASMERAWVPLASTKADAANDPVAVPRMIALPLNASPEDVARIRALVEKDPERFWRMIAEAENEPG